MKRRTIFLVLFIVVLTFLPTMFSNVPITGNLKQGKNSFQSIPTVGVNSKINSKYTEKNLLLLPVQFPDQSASTTVNAQYSTWYNGTTSVKDYFYNQSYGNFNLSVQIQPWITASLPIVYYADKSNQATLEPELIQYALNYWDSAIDYSLYNYVFVIYSGIDDNTNSSFMPHTITSTFTTNERTFNESALIGETTSFGTCTFIFGEILGLMSYGSSAGGYDLMGTGYTNIAGPSGLSAYSKLMLGWINDTVIETIPKDTFFQLNLYSLDLENVSYNQFQMAKYVIDTNHYFLIEYRPSIGYDSQFSSGIYVWSIDLTKNFDQGRLTILGAQLISNKSYYSDSHPLSIFPLTVGSNFMGLYIDTKNSLNFSGQTNSGSKVFNYLSQQKGNVLAFIIKHTLTGWALTYNVQYYNTTSASWVSLNSYSTSSTAKYVIYYRTPYSGDYRIYMSTIYSLIYYYYQHTYQYPYADVSGITNTPMTENNPYFNLTCNIINTHEAPDYNANVNLTLPTGLVFANGEKSFRNIPNTYINQNNFVTYQLKAVSEVSDYLIFNYTSQYGSRLIYKLITIKFSPDITHPADTQFEQGTTGKWINWTITGQNPGNYTVYQDGSQIQFNNWVNNTQVNVSLNNLIFGTYNYTIQARTASNYATTDTVIVTVVDSTRPTVSQLTNRTQSYDSSNNILNWTVNDLNPSNYSIYINQVLKKAASWSGSSITYSVDGLDLGLYNVTIVVQDMIGNKNHDTLWVMVVDGTKPFIQSSSGNMSIQIGVNDEIYWVLADHTPNYYTLYQNGYVIKELQWANLTRVSVWTGNLAFGSYNFTIVAYDKYNNILISSQFVSVIDSVNPIILSSSGNVSVLPSQNAELYWVLADRTPNYYSLYQNGTLIKQLPWTNLTRVSVWTGSLGPGKYNFTIVVVDGYLNSVTVTQWAIVSDTSPPVLVDSSGNLTVEIGSQQELYWVISDYAPDYYILYHNSTLERQVSWSNMTRISVWTDSLGFGRHNYTLLAMDKFGNSNVLTFWVTVIDSSVPSIVDTSGNLVVEIGQNKELYWVVSDNLPGTYILYYNNSVEQDLTWTNNTRISVWTVSLGFGSHNFTLVANDKYGNEITSTLWVTVVDTESPVIQSSSGNLTINLGTNSDLYWVVSDRSPNFYILYENGTILQELQWTNNSQITVWTGTLNYGRYNYTLVAYDGANNKLVSTQWIIVQDTTAPVVVGDFTDQTLTEGYGLVTRTWNVTDETPVKITIFVNNTLISQANLTDLSYVFTLNNLVNGTYQYTILFQDEFNNTIIKSFTVIVQPIIRPPVTVISSIPYTTTKTMMTTKSSVSTATDTTTSTKNKQSPGFEFIFLLLAFSIAIIFRKRK